LEKGQGVSEVFRVWHKRFEALLIFDVPAVVSNFFEKAETSLAKPFIRLSVRTRGRNSEGVWQ